MFLQPGVQKVSIISINDWRKFDFSQKTLKNTCPEKPYRVFLMPTWIPLYIDRMSTFHSSLYWSDTCSQASSQIRRKSFNDLGHLFGFAAILRLLDSLIKLKKIWKTIFSKKTFFAMCPTFTILGALSGLQLSGKIEKCPVYHEMINITPTKYIFEKSNIRTF